MRVGGVSSPLTPNRTTTTRSDDRRPIRSARRLCESKLGKQLVAESLAGGIDDWRTIGGGREHADRVEKPRRDLPQLEVVVRTLKA